VESVTTGASGSVTLMAKETGVARLPLESMALQVIWVFPIGKVEPDTRPVSVIQKALKPVSLVSLTVGEVKVTTEPSAD